MATYCVWISAWVLRRCSSSCPCWAMSWSNSSSPRKRHPIACPHGQAMGCLLWVGWQFSMFLWYRILLEFQPEFWEGAEAALPAEQCPEATAHPWLHAATEGTGHGCSSQSAAVWSPGHQSHTAFRQILQGEVAGCWGDILMRLWKLPLSFCNWLNVI